MYERHLKAIGKIDIIMSHDCPYGISDIILQKDCWWADGSHIGNTALRWFIDEAKPEIVVKGHLHTTNRDVEMNGNTRVYSVSLLNENYEMTYEPTYIDIEL
jgi:Icc-related predicted phosphoesterase